LPITGFVDRVAFTIRLYLSYACEHSLTRPADGVIAIVLGHVHAASYHRMAHGLEFPVNDIGMVLFLALATKQVVEAATPGGALHTWRRGALPCIAAIGGMAAPAQLYLLHVTLAGELALARGWAIPSATDIGCGAGVGVGSTVRCSSERRVSTGSIVRRGKPWSAFERRERRDGVRSGGRIGCRPIQGFAGGTSLTIITFSPGRIRPSSRRAISSIALGSSLRRCAVSRSRAFSARCRAISAESSSYW
jgi:Na+/H+ antiporter 1